MRIPPLIYHTGPGETIIDTEYLPSYHAARLAGKDKGCGKPDCCKGKDPDCGCKDKDKGKKP